MATVEVLKDGIYVREGRRCGSFNYSEKRIIDMSEFNSKVDKENDRVKNLTKEEAIAEGWMIKPVPPQDAYWEDDNICRLIGIGNTYTETLHSQNINTFGDAHRIFSSGVLKGKLNLPTKVINLIENVLHVIKKGSFDYSPADLRFQTKGVHPYESTLSAEV